ncbi:MAG: PD-(D/E)XK nuclease family transposase, partial [Rhodospirillaceae bacterium]
VVAVTITDFTMFPDLGRVISRFSLRADENPAICYKDLDLIFAELPKFTKGEDELECTIDRWLYFLKTASDLTAIPKSLAMEPAIVHAFELANRAGLSVEEIDFIETREHWVREQQVLLQKARNTEQRAMLARSEGLAEGKAEGLAEGKAEGLANGLAKGLAKGKAEMLLRQLRRRYDRMPVGVEGCVRAANSDQLDEWSERFADGKSLNEIFDPDQLC